MARCEQAKLTDVWHKNFLLSGIFSSCCTLNFPMKFHIIILFPFHFTVVGFNKLHIQAKLTSLHRKFSHVRFGMPQCILNCY